jgi:putative CocE/NonD family hydrolase
MAQIIVDRNTEIKMRDNTVLRADVYRPAHGGPFPVLLHRIPYNKSFAWIAASLMLNPLNAVDQGYAVVIQDCRGRFASDGEWNPFHVEADDGYDTVEWCAQQPWSNGKVGIYGSSYMGITVWQAVAAAPPHLQAAFAYVTGTNYHEGFTYSGGAFELGFNMWWATFLAWDKLTKLPEEKQGTAMQRLMEAASNPSMAYKYLPLKEFSGLQDVAPFYYDWLQHPSYDQYWQAVNIEEQYGKITVPVLQMTGWFDNFLIGHLNSFVGIRQKGGSEKARKNQKIVVGPWTHENYLSLTMSKVGDIEFGPVAMPNTEILAFRWFDYWLKDINNGIMDEPPVRIFVTGENVWRDEKDWPLPRAKETKWYLHSGGHANTLQGDGTLTSVIPESGPPDSFAYDPCNPVPTVGGRTLMPGIASDGFRDQRTVEGRADVLVYTSPIFMKDTEVTGPVAVKLWAASSCRDTDFTAKLIDVYPDGYAALVADGILRARYRESMAQPKPLEPAQIYELTIDLWAVSRVFKAGHQIRLEISSSNFPRFDRNLNTGEDNASESRMQTAIQTIYHDAQHPSHVVLHVVG